MNILSQTLKDTLYLRSFGLLKIPLLAFVRPSVIESSPQRVEVKIPLNRWTRNHLKSMYFGAMAIGADTAVGLLAFKGIDKSSKKINLIFKDFRADFLQRAEGHVHFICEEGDRIRELIQQCENSGERVTEPIRAYAVVPSINDDPVAEFILNLSLKVKN